MNAPCNCINIDHIEHNIGGFPLTTFLDFYSKNQRRLYINYLEEFKLFVEFLGPFYYSVPKDVPRQAWYEGNYEVQEIARILNIDQSVLFYILRNHHYGHR